MRTYEQHQYRILNEQADVNLRLQALTDFVACAMFVALPLQEQDRQRRKLRVLREYASILAEQVEAF